VSEKDNDKDKDKQETRIEEPYLDVTSDRKKDFNTEKEIRKQNEMNFGVVQEPDSVNNSNPNTGRGKAFVT
jgi:hypothetical protein